MKKYLTGTLITAFTIVLISFTYEERPANYFIEYKNRIDVLQKSHKELITLIGKIDLKSPENIDLINEKISDTRIKMKSADFWLRYLDPLAYKKINGPLPVEWETEVFEKFEKPYKREGAGLTLAALYLEEPVVKKDSLLKLITLSDNAIRVYLQDSIVRELKSYHHFFLCNRLFLLNLAAIYTTGFECPDGESIIPELSFMMSEVNSMYNAYNESFPDTPLPENYRQLFGQAITFVKSQPLSHEEFDHFTFLKQYVNPLFAINQELIVRYQVSSKSFVDYSLNKHSNSIFSKNLYNGQNPKGIFLRVKDQDVLAEIDRVGKLLFYDPILSGNNQRSCVSCHNSTQYFTDTTTATSLQFNRKDFLQRNTPSLINVEYNHLIMLDGKHISLQHQTKAVITNPTELGITEKEVLEKILSCGEYEKTFKKLLVYTPQEKEITIDHIVSAITFYYSKFSRYYSPFDDAINHEGDLDESVKRGFNVFMSKAECATCHFVPQFNGVKPPYIGSEFEVLGIPADIRYSALSMDSGRFGINPATETAGAFRTGTIRNAAYTMPYMHNGVFKNLNEVLDFYDGGGGAGRGLTVDNQTLSSDSLHLTKSEKDDLLRFISSLNEKITFENPPAALPVSRNKLLNARKVGGEY